MKKTCTIESILLKKRKKKKRASLVSQITRHGQNYSLKKSLICNISFVWVQSLQAIHKKPSGSNLFWAHLNSQTKEIVQVCLTDALC